MSAVEYVRNQRGIFQPSVPVQHRDEHYNEEAFKTLFDMQGRHFWYRGRHRFLLHAVSKRIGGRNGLSAIDLGGGCGGWIGCLNKELGRNFAELALADSSLSALELASGVLPPETARYQIDLMSLHWENRWDVAFLLDVIEHLPDDAGALREVYRALKPGGLLFVTTPALKFFWTYNDEVARHIRRYSKADYATLAEKTGLRLLKSHYFMFFLSPLLWLSRISSKAGALNDEERLRLANRAHAVPSPLVNGVLSMLFAAETPIGQWLPFPWGTSILAVFQKPS